MKHFSHTRISTYQQCRLQYRYKYIDDAEPAFDHTVETFMGDLVHRTIEKYHEDLKYEETNTADDLVEHYHDLWEDEWDDDIRIVKDEYDKTNYKDQGERMIRDYHSRYHPFDASNTIANETMHRYQLTEEHDVSIRIDRLDNPAEGVYEVHDYKTSNSLPTKDEAEADTQLATYALGVKDMYPDAERIRLIWHYLAFDREVTVEKDWSELDVIEEQLVGVIHDIEDTEEYEPSKSPLCHYCGYQPRCPLWEHKFQDDEEARSAEALVEEYIDLKQEEQRIQDELDDIQAELNAYMESHNVDRVFDGQGRNVYRWSKDVTKFPHKSEEQNDLWEALDALGVLEDYLKVDTWSLENDVDSLDEIKQEVLKRLGEQKTIKRFYWND